MKIYTVNLEKLRREKKPLPSSAALQNCVLLNNTHFIFYQHTKAGRFIVECDRKPRSIQACGVSWQRIS